MQWKLLPSDRHKTCFTWRGIKCQFIGAPFGLKPLTGAVQNTQDQIFADLPFVLCYVDDIIVHSASLDEHILHLQAVLQRINAYNLKLKLEKCVFLTSVVILLGHRISGDIIFIDPSKLINLHSWPIPNSFSSVSSFLRFYNYFRNFIPNYTVLASPLESIRSTKVKNLTLTSEQLTSFNVLKLAISQKF